MSAAKKKGSKRGRIRAHANPLSDPDFDYPMSPEAVDWSVHYPAYFSPLSSKSQPGATDSKSAAPMDVSSAQKREVRIADVGCGFGGLLVALGPLFPDTLILGLEIREPVVKIVKERIAKLRTDAAQEQQSSTNAGGYQNVSVVRTNIMKFAPNYFRKGQLDKMFFCFPDPHFKKSKFRRRVINPNFLAIYAYILRVGGMLYTISDVKDLHEWMAKHLSEHPLFERVSMEELKDDPCVPAMTDKTEEGQKVTKNNGSKFPAVFRRIEGKSIPSGAQPMKD
jgi:tRNA (guanine-N7-)-methyltransferase